MQQRNITSSLFVGIQFGAGLWDIGWRGHGTWLAGTTAQVYSEQHRARAPGCLIVILVLYHSGTCFFPLWEIKFKTQYSYYTSGMRHTCLISVLAFLESVVDCVSCCVQNSYPLNKTVFTLSTPPGNQNCQFTNQNTPDLLSIFLLEKTYQI